MKNIYNSWAYNVRYWKNGSDEKVSLENCMYLKYRPPVLCSVLVWGHCSEERRLGGHLVRVLQGGSASRSRESKAWPAEQASSQPEGWPASPAHAGGKFTEQIFRVLAQREWAFLSPKGSCRRRRSWLSSWLAELTVSWVTWSAEWQLFHGTSPVPHIHHRTVGPVVRQPHPGRWMNRVTFYLLEPTLLHCSSPFQGTVPLKTRARSRNLWSECRPCHCVTQLRFLTSASSCL